MKIPSPPTPSGPLTSGNATTTSYSNLAPTTNLPPPLPLTSHQDATGNKHCNQCNLFMIWEGLWCPCCGCRLRIRPRHSKFKKMLREQKSKISYHHPLQIL